MQTAIRIGSGALHVPTADDIRRAEAACGTADGAPVWRVRALPLARIYPARILWIRGKVTAVLASLEDVVEQVQQAALEQARHELTRYRVEFTIAPDGTVAGSSAGAMAQERDVVEIASAITSADVIADAIRRQKTFDVAVELSSSSHACAQPLPTGPDGAAVLTRRPNGGSSSRRGPGNERLWFGVGLMFGLMISVFIWIAGRESRTRGISDGTIHEGFGLEPGSICGTGAGGTGT